MSHRSTRIIIRAVAALTLGAATAPSSLAPVFADELQDDSSNVVVVDCADPTLVEQLAVARDAAADAKRAFTDLRGPNHREVRERRAEARADAREARRALREHRGKSLEDRAAAKAARAELRAAQKTLRASYKEAVRALKAERRATKAAWDDAKEAFHGLRAAVEDCATDETTGEDTDQSEGTTDQGSEDTDVTMDDGTEDPTL